MNPLIVQYLPQDLHEIAASYMIPDQFISQIPDIIEMVLRSSSIEKKEDKQSWFNLMPLMNADQMQKFKEILLKEKTKLAEIEAKYSTHKTTLGSQQLQQRQESQYISQMAVIKKAEEQHKQQESVEADTLLQNL